jgi:hypothetical protein
VYDQSVLRRRIVPAWLRRGCEAGVIGALLSVGTLVAFQLSRPAPRLTLPNGIDTSLILTPAVAALGILAVTYPTFLAATRREAIYGVVAALFVAADAFLVVSLVARDAVFVHPLGRSFPLGLVAIALAVPVAIAATLIGQLTSPLGFGRSTGLRSAVGGAALGLIAVVAAAYSI